MIIRSYQPIAYSLTSLSSYIGYWATLGALRSLGSFRALGALRKRKDRSWSFAIRASDFVTLEASLRPDKTTPQVALQASRFAKASQDKTPRQAED